MQLICRKSLNGLPLLMKLESVYSEAVTNLRVPERMCSEKRSVIIGEEAVLLCSRGQLEPKEELAWITQRLTVLAVALGVKYS